MDISGLPHREVFSALMAGGLGLRMAQKTVRVYNDRSRSMIVDARVRTRRKAGETQEYVSKGNPRSRHLSAKNSKMVVLRPTRPGRNSVEGKLG